MNAHGLRDRERTLGDSFTWAVGVPYDNGFVARNEKALQEVVPGTEI